MSGRRSRQDDIRAQVETVTERLIQHVRDEARLAVVKAPPGAGKTHVLLKAAEAGLKTRQRVAIATQTNSQADDICRRLSGMGVPCIRFVRQGAVGPSQWVGVQIIADQKSLPMAPCIVVGTTAKWGLIELAVAFDVLFVEEAWQMSWANFMLLGQVAARFVLIGDPGQIPPVVTIDTARWETAPRAPHRPAPELVLEAQPTETLSLSLPATWRLPACSADLIRPFYDFPFGTFAEHGERALKPTRGRAGPLGALIGRLCTTSVAGLTVRTPEGGPPMECDEEVAGIAVDVVRAMLESQASCLSEGETRPLTAADIGLCATHHVMNAAMSVRLDKKLAGVSIDTPERWQGLERKVMVVVHPLSGVVEPSAFDLETGRLCVMASRHKISLVVVTRDHLADTLDSHLPSAGQAVGRPDVTGRGHFQNTQFWSSLTKSNQVVGMTRA
jgi:hypothetical protein